jgi:hypothetical protein
VGETQTIKANKHTSEILWSLALPGVGHFIIKRGEGIGKGKRCW